jgi:predicted nucleic acid-binding Zn ribbon protein
MSLHLDSIEQILTQLEIQPGWEKFRAHRQLLKCWSQVVNQQTAQHTRPLYINRQILYVATSSSARAQELAFQRYTLLKRLNQQQQLILEIKDEIKDIHFSSFQWHQLTYSQETQVALFTISVRQKIKIVPAQLNGIKQDNKAENRNNHLSSQERAKNAAQRCLRTIKLRSEVALTCPQCGSVCSQAELNRWNLCHHCVAHKCSAEYRPPTFPEQE